MIITPSDSKEEIPVPLESEAQPDKYIGDIVIVNIAHLSGSSFQILLLLLYCFH